MAILPGFGITVPDYPSGMTFDGTNWSGIDSSASNPLWQEWAKSTGMSSGSTGSTQPPPETAEARAERLAREERERIEALRTKNANAILSAQMESMGLGSLASQITTWIQEGYEPDAVMALIRQSPEYAARFPAMKALQAKGRSISEAEYIGYEKSMSAYEKMFGLPQGMLTDKDMVTKLLTQEVSVREIEERATRASMSMYNLPQEYRDMMRNYYGIDSGGLTAYMLDPDVASPLLEKQFVSAQIGMEAAMRSIGVDRSLAETLFERGVTREEAQTGFNAVGVSGGLSAGRGDTATEKQRIGAAFKLDVESQQATQRAAESRAQRFTGGGGFEAGKSGVSSLGSSST